MSWLVWRQYRAQGAIAFALLAAAAAVILVDGFQIASHWHSTLATCAGKSACLQQQGPLINGVVSDLPYISLIVPVVLGMLWGAPLVAHELETRTSDFAWAQSVTRTRWLTVKVGWLLLAAAACGGVIAALITWWSGPTNALFASAFTPGKFDTQGIVPIGYAVFAMALGIAAGTVARRTVPAIAVALGGFIALRLVISDFLRQHYMAAVTTYYNVTGSFTPPGAPWVLAQGAVSRTGVEVATGWGDLYPALPASCQKVLLQSEGTAGKSGTSMNAVFSCMQAHGWRGFVAYQPASRYWPFQGIETGIYVALATALIAVTFVIVRRRDG
jgi:ABC-2 family transporter